MGNFFSLSNWDEPEIAVAEVANNNRRNTKNGILDLSGNSVEHDAEIPNAATTEELTINATEAPAANAAATEAPAAPTVGGKRRRTRRKRRNHAKNSRKSK